MVFLWSGLNKRSHANANSRSPFWYVTPAISNSSFIIITLSLSFAICVSCLVSLFASTILIEFWWEWEGIGEITTSAWPLVRLHWVTTVCGMRERKWTDANWKNGNIRTYSGNSESRLFCVYVQDMTRSCHYPIFSLFHTHMYTHHVCLYAINALRAFSYWCSVKCELSKLENVLPIITPTISHRWQTYLPFFPVSFCFHTGTLERIHKPTHIKHIRQP